MRAADCWQAARQIQSDSMTSLLSLTKSPLSQARKAALPCRSDTRFHTAPRILEDFESKNDLAVQGYIVAVAGRVAGSGRPRARFDRAGINCALRCVCAAASRATRELAVVALEFCRQRRQSRCGWAVGRSLGKRRLAGRFVAFCACAVAAVGRRGIDGFVGASAAAAAEGVYTETYFSVGTRCARRSPAIIRAGVSMPGRRAAGCVSNCLSSVFRALRCGKSISHRRRGKLVLARGWRRTRLLAGAIAPASSNVGTRRWHPSLKAQVTRAWLASSGAVALASSWRRG